MDCTVHTVVPTMLLSMAGTVSTRSTNAMPVTRITTIKRDATPLFACPAVAMVACCISICVHSYADTAGCTCTGNIVCDRVPPHQNDHVPVYTYIQAWLQQMHGRLVGLVEIDETFQRQDVSEMLEGVRSFIKRFEA